MAKKKDKFAQLQEQGGGVLGSFQNLAKTVAAIDNQEQSSSVPSTSSTASSISASSSAKPVINPQEQPRFMRLPNPKIPLKEYNLVSNFCNSFANMTRQDFVELAIIEKLHNEGILPQEDFDIRYKEIRERPSRGHRRGTMSDSSSSK